MAAATFSKQLLEVLLAAQLVSHFYLCFSLELTTAAIKDGRGGGGAMQSNLPVEKEEQQVQVPSAKTGMLVLGRGGG